VRVAFLGHSQPRDGSVRPSGGYISKSEAEALVRLLVAERISQKRIRAFEPGLYRALSPISFMPQRLPSAELPGVKFIPPPTDLRPKVSALKAGWDWTKEADYLPQAITA